jgi:MoaA/NifB/PqqE/SkfB family radical SAM enzyme
MMGRKESEAFFKIGGHFISTCNNNCIFCSRLSSNIERSTTEEIKSEIYRGKCIGFEKLLLSGGEPTVRRDFLEILSYANDIGYKFINVHTNGRMFYYPEFTKKFINTGYHSVTIPLHAPNADLHDEITRAPSSFEQTVCGIKNLLKYNDRICIEIDVPIHKMNYQHLPAIAKFISRNFNGIQQVGFFLIDFGGNAEINKSRLFVKITETKPLIEEALGILKKKNLEYNLSCIPYCIIDKKYWKNMSTRSGRVIEQDVKIDELNGAVCTIFKSCNGCIMKEKCPGTWQRYASEVGTSEFKPIKSR